MTNSRSVGRLNLTFKLIEQLSQDPDSYPQQEKKLDQAINFYYASFFLKEKASSLFRNLFLTFFISTFFIPTFAEASLISFVTDLFVVDGNNIKTEEKTINLQNMALLQAAVNTDPNPIKNNDDVSIVDGTALLPETGPSGTVADIIDEKNPSSDQISVYVVRKGDTLAEIAKMFNVSKNTIVWANDIKGGILKEGQTIVILPITGIKYTVKTGDTLQKIANKYKGDIDEIGKFNNISGNAKLVAGDEIIIPDGEITTAPATRRNITTSKIVLKDTQGPDYNEYYIRPLEGGRRSQGLHGHNGIDFSSPKNTPILASASGEVLISKEDGWNGGYGGYVVIKHSNGTQTLYAHNSKNLVSVGEHVNQGQIIGYVGSTGKSTGPHVHFEVRGAKNPFR